MYLQEQPGLLLYIISGGELLSSFRQRLLDFLRLWPFPDYLKALKEIVRLQRGNTKTLLYIIYKLYIYDVICLIMI